MNKVDRDVVLGLRFSDRELESRSRNKTGYNVFQGWFTSDFEQCSSDEKQELLMKYGIVGDDFFDGVDDPNYADIASVPEIGAVHRSKLCGKYWRVLPAKGRMAWKERAELVNDLPAVGVFDSVPDYLKPSLETIVAKSLTNEFDRFARIMKKAVRYKALTVDVKKMKQFGNERFHLQLQVFRSFYISHLLITTLFGVTNFSSLRSYEVVYKKEVVVAHLFSSRRLREIFTFNQVFPFEYHDGSNHYSVGAKVYLVDRGDGKECIGCVMEEDTESLHVVLESGESVTVPRPFFSNEDKSWHYSHNDEYNLKQIDPIRIKIMQSGSFHITINRFLSVNGHIISI